MTEPVTILMPVGPNYNEEWLKEAVNSALEQTYPIKELLIVDDGALLTSVDLKEISYYTIDYRHITPAGKVYGLSHEGGSVIRYFPTTFSTEVISYYKIPANVGFRAAFNIGVGIASGELVMFLAADDKLMPEAVEKAVQCYLDHDRKDAWYALSYITSSGELGTIPNNLALTTKHFFLDMCGGYPPAAFVGPDAALLSCLMVHAPDRIIKVEDGTPLYWIREHEQQETTLHTTKYLEEMNSIRNKLTLEFKLKE